MSRHVALGAVFAIAAFLLTPLAAAPARAAASTAIEINPGMVEGSLSPQLFGANHRYAQDGYGMWDAANDRPYPGIVTRAGQVGISIVRYPGGTIANTFNWETAIGPVADRSCQVGTTQAAQSGTSQSAVYGPDEHLQFVNDIGAQANLVVNFATETPQQAADWVAYMNAPLGTSPWAELRARNGHPAPYDVTWWEVGNEMQNAAQRYWMGSTGSGSEAAQKYAFGGSTAFVDQPVVTQCDWSASASLSTGQANQIVFANFPPVAPGTGSVSVGGTGWTQVASLSGSAPDADVYTLDNSTGEIMFGDGIHGAIPPAGAQITISYTSGPHAGFVDFYRAMKAVDPHINVCASFQSTAFLQAMGADNPYDCLEVHPYTTKVAPGTAPSVHDELMAAADARAAGVEGWVQEMAQLTGRDIPAVVTEYGFFSNSALPAQYESSLDAGLYTATNLVGLTQAHVPVGEEHTLTNFGRGETLFGAGPTFFPTGPALVIGLFSHMSGSQVVSDTVTNNPVHQSAAGTYDALQVLATASSGGNLYLMVVNRDPVNDVQTEVQTPAFSYSAQALVCQVDAPSYLTYTSSADPQAISTTGRVVSVPTNGFSYTFPAHSVTAIELTTGPGAPAPGSCG